MPRAKRTISGSGVYHVVFRGMNKQTLFECNEDYQKMHSILLSLKGELSFCIYAYCFMGNHVHLLLKEANAGEISLIMKRLLTRYVQWYNKKYQRSGALIANRYKSEPVEVDSYLLNVVRYIHQNPIRAGLTNSLATPEYCSYRDYLRPSASTAPLTDTAFLLELLPLPEFELFHQETEPLAFLVEDKMRKSDEIVQREIELKCNLHAKKIIELPKPQRDALLRLLKEEYSLRQLERVTGISRGVIYKS